MALVQVVQGAVILSNDVNQIIVGLDGTSAVDFTIKGAITHENGARAYFRSGAGATISNEIGVVGGTTFNYLGIAHASATVAAATNVPMFNMDAHIRPNQSQTTNGETGASWMLKTVRYGSGTTASALDGNLAAHYAFLVQAESDSTYTGYNGGHDEVAVNGIVTIHGLNDVRGGQFDSFGRGWGGYFEAINYSPKGQAIGAEIQVVNNSGTTAAPLGAAGFSVHHYGLQLVSNVNNIGATSGPVATGSFWNTAALRLAATSEITKNSFRYGMVVETNSIKDYVIATFLGPVGAATTWAFPPFVVMGTGQGVFVRASDGTDVQLLNSDAANSALNLYFAKSSGTDRGIGFLNQAGTTMLGITPTGPLNFAGNTAVFRAVTGSGITPAFAAVTGVSGMPTATNPAAYARAFSGSGTTFYCWPLWQTT